MENFYRKVNNTLFFNVLRKNREKAASTIGGGVARESNTLCFVHYRHQGKPARPGPALLK